MLWKKIIQKGEIRITYTEHKHKNTGTSVLIYSQNVEKKVSLEASFGLSVEM